MVSVPPLRSPLPGWAATDAVLLPSAAAGGNGDNDDGGLAFASDAAVVCLGEARLLTSFSWSGQPPWRAVTVIQAVRPAAVADRHAIDVAVAAGHAVAAWPQTATAARGGRSGRGRRPRGPACCRLHHPRRRL